MPLEDKHLYLADPKKTEAAKYVSVYKSLCNLKHTIIVRPPTTANLVNIARSQGLNLIKEYNSFPQLVKAEIPFDTDKLRNMLESIVVE